MERVHARLSNSPAAELIRRAQQLAEEARARHGTGMGDTVAPGADALPSGTPSPTGSLHPSNAATPSGSRASSIDLNATLDEMAVQGQGAAVPGTGATRARSYSPQGYGMDRHTPALMLPPAPAFPPAMPPARRRSPSPPRLTHYLDRGRSPVRRDNVAPPPPAPPRHTQPTVRFDPGTDLLTRYTDPLPPVGYNPHYPMPSPVKSESTQLAEALARIEAAQARSDPVPPRTDWKAIERAAKKVTACEGKEKDKVKQWAYEVGKALVSPSEKVLLARYTARGALDDYLSTTHEDTWEALRQHALSKFVAHNYQHLARRQVQRVRQGVKEPLTVFNIRFEREATEGYTHPWTDTEESVLVDAYLAALANEAVADDVMEEGELPSTLEEAMGRAEKRLRKEEIKRAAGRDTRTQNISEVSDLRAEVAALTSQLKEQRLAPENRGDLHKVMAEVAALTTFVKKSQSENIAALGRAQRVAPVDAQAGQVAMDRAMAAPQQLPQPPPPQPQPMQPPPQQLNPQASPYRPQYQPIVCYKCGKPGHMMRDCRWQTPPRPSRNIDDQGRPICFNCRKGGHMQRECRAPRRDRQPVTSRYTQGSNRQPKNL